MKRFTLISTTKATLMKCSSEARHTFTWNGWTKIPCGYVSPRKTTRTVIGFGLIRGQISKDARNDHNPAPVRPRRHERGGIWASTLHSEEFASGGNPFQARSTPRPPRAPAVGILARSRALGRRVGGRNPGMVLRPFGGGGVGDVRVMADQSKIERPHSRRQDVGRNAGGARAMTPPALLTVVEVAVCFWKRRGLNDGA